MSVLSAELRRRLFAMRKLSDEAIRAIPMATEAEFNASADAINNKLDAIRVWLPLKSYTRGDVRIDPANGWPYWAMHSHTSYVGQEQQPSFTPSIWTHCHGTDKGSARPFVAEGHNPYMKGHYCIENDVAYRCNANNTVHPPSVLPQAWEDA